MPDPVTQTDASADVAAGVARRSPLALRVAVVVVPIIAIATLFGLVAFRARPVEQGSAAPAWDLERLDTSGRLTNVDLAGKPYVVNVWASWCGPCRDESPILQKVASSTQTPIIGMDVLDGREEARKFIAEFGLTYPNVSDAAAVHRRFGVTGVPETVFIDAKGKVAGRWIGAIDEPTLRSMIADLEAGRAVKGGASDKRTSVG